MNNRATLKPFGTRARLWAEHQPQHFQRSRRLRLFPAPFVAELLRLVFQTQSRSGGVVLLAVFLALAPIGLSAANGPQLPPHRKVTLTNGLTLLLMEQHEVPLISFHALFRTGSVADPNGKEGTALLTAELLRRGTQTRSANQIASELDFIGFGLDIGGDPDRVSVSGEFLKKDTDAALDVLGDVLQHPSFPAAEVEKLIKQRVDGIKGDKEEAQAVLPRYFASTLFGSHPYGRPPGGDERSLTAIQRDDIVAFYEHYFGPETMVLAVAGDFGSADMERLLSAKFDGWKPTGRTAASKLAPPAPVTGRKLLLVNKPDTTQTYFAIGNVGIARNNPDRTGVSLVNLLFGGRFTSMLNDALRINSGLTYGAKSQFQQRCVAGPFIISTFTANTNTVRAMDLALETLENLHRDGVSEAQLRSAKDYLKGQFPPRIETTGQLASLMADLEFYGLDDREVNELFQRIDAFTTADARRIIRQYFPKENLVFALIGKTGEIRDSVKKYASQIEQREIETPGFK